MRKEYFLVLDTETCNTVEEPIPYDIGWVICDRYGNIFEKHSFVVAEVFLDMKDVMKSAYYAEKIPKYWDELKAGKRKLDGMWNIRRLMKTEMKKYHIKKVGAYNMSFDRKALNNLMRYVSKSFMRFWFPFNTEFFCIWNMACNALLNRITYVKFALKNGLISPSDNLLTSAEATYKYITKNADFSEEHTGLEDVLIEVEIMAYCYRQHKKLETKINRLCWREPQKKKKEFLKSA